MLLFINLSIFEGLTTYFMEISIDNWLNLGSLSHLHLYL